MFRLWGKGCYGAEWPTRAVGHHRTVTRPERETFKGPLLSETCRMGYSTDSAFAAIDPKGGIWPQSCNYLPFKSTA